MRRKRVDKDGVRASIAKMVAKYAELSPFFLNPDNIVVENIVTGLTRNKNKHGNAYCPCREVLGVPEKDRDNICPCRTHREEIAHQGTCECGLFVNEAYISAKRRQV